MPQSTGLTVSRVLIEAHQGTLALNSVAGAGLMATVTLTSARVFAGARDTSRNFKLAASATAPIALGHGAAVRM